MLNNVVILHSLSFPTFQAMTSHVAYVIYAQITLITTQGLVTLQFLLCLSFPLCTWDRTFLMSLTFFPFLSYPCRLTHSVLIRNQVY